MQAVWLENQRLTVRQDLPIPHPAPGFALLKLRLAGICSTDLELVRGYYPYNGVPGHEFVGEVAEVNVDQALALSWIGQRVVGEINLTCGTCTACLDGRSTHCEQRTVLGIANHPGVFAEYLTLPLRNLHRVPDNIPDEAAVFTEPLAAALEIQQQVQIHPSDRVLVVGAGRLGLLIAQALALTGCDLQVVVRRQAPRALLQGWGIACIESQAVSEGSMDVVVEVTGSPEGFALARKAVRTRGTLVLKSTYAGSMQVNFSSIVVDELTLIGSRCGPFAPALKLLADRRVDPRPLIVQSYPLAQGVEAFEHAGRAGALKILLTSL